MSCDPLKPSTEEITLLSRIAAEGWMCDVGSERERENVEEGASL